MDEGENGTCGGWVLMKSFNMNRDLGIEVVKELEPVRKYELELLAHIANCLAVVPGMADTVDRISMRVA
ncbi:MAG: hypothetical protein GX859_05950 [Corynebacterium humireducens]|uniref:Uncharacterized protein n=1 Tax=Corynebacterium humireducens TaxID=1223514 RepID=A0A7X6PMQ5_9CORY|nr:hypothetical protein [Corynebacterium humireducens]